MLNLPLLTGLRILDLTRNLPGPFATRILNDLGAQIIKVEPLQGDPARAMGPLFESLNYNKDCRRVDFHSAAGRATILEWAQDCDVVLESFRPGVLDAMGLGYNHLQAIRPALVLCSITGYGQHGPWANRAGHDLNFMALSGALDQLKSAQGEVIMPNMQWGDVAGGSAMAATTILAAVLNAHQHGKGRHLDISMTHGVRYFHVMPQATKTLMTALLGQEPGPAQDLLNGSLPCYNLYTTQDKRYLAVGALEAKFWRQFAEVIDRPDWGNLHWQLGLMPGSAASDDLREQVAQLIATQPLHYWSVIFAERDACVTPVLTLDEAGNHPVFAGQQHTPWSQISSSS